MVADRSQITSPASVLVNRRLSDSCVVVRWSKKVEGANKCSQLTGGGVNTTAL